MAAARGHPTVSVDQLRDWEEHGAVWRPIELDDEHAIIDLCSCSGEAMERAWSNDPELIAFARARWSS